MAQVSLADEIMSSAEQEIMLLTASVLFTMALVRGCDSKEALGRLMHVECARLSGMGVDVPSEEFYESPVVKVFLLMFV